MWVRHALKPRRRPKPSAVSQQCPTLRPEPSPHSGPSVVLPIGGPLRKAQYVWAVRTSVRMVCLAVSNRTADMLCVRPTQQCSGIRSRSGTRCPILYLWLYVDGGYGVRDTCSGGPGVCTAIFACVGGVCDPWWSPKYSSDCCPTLQHHVFLNGMFFFNRNRV
jgi:hypothetical protein